MDYMLRMKSQISSFENKINPTLYFVWEIKIESLHPFIIDCNDFHIINLCYSKFVCYVWYQR